MGISIPRTGFLIFHDQTTLWIISKFKITISTNWIQQALSLLWTHRYLPQHNVYFPLKNGSSFIVIFHRNITFTPKSSINLPIPQDSGWVPCRTAMVRSLCTHSAHEGFSSWTYTYDSCSHKTGVILSTYSFVAFAHAALHCLPVCNADNSPLLLGHCTLWLVLIKPVPGLWKELLGLRQHGGVLLLLRQPQCTLRWAAKLFLCVALFQKTGLPSFGVNHYSYRKGEGRSYWRISRKAERLGNRPMLGPKGGGRWLHLKARRTTQKEGVCPVADNFVCNGLHKWGRTQKGRREIWITNVATKGERWETTALNALLEAGLGLREIFLLPLLKK